MNEFVFTSMRPVFVCFLEEVEDTKKTFRNYLTFNARGKNNIYLVVEHEIEYWESIISTQSVGKNVLISDKLPSFCALLSVYCIL